ncbi:MULTISPECIES: hypothetical protein [Pseudomonas]|jgi:hypothetical protein|uniref:hypothetical protein n=1 Tax=Pseudomonas TaxID=286 RepID=UPI00089A5D67|nr:MULTISPECIES: hypothetical protein [Pseudomonas]KAA8702854.1 hypothetical protein F4W61_10470 [Pseudomonas proteolytica]MBT9303714.1 hypothetical protein [Pseudomonas sp. TAE6080]NMY21156.1 hypothetical protein [Pseudomonas sp. WS 5410]TWR80849.1 hypothetical protein FIV38_16210 [Pseudomonas proteolytica]SEE20996.1 hypothetical protein SAMN04490200_3876 [Pseudomonas proteolytica]
MTDESPTQRKTRLARERKRAQRKRDKDKRLAMGASKLKMEIYSGTRSEVEQIRSAGAFDETEHALTMAIHGVAALSRNDPAAFQALIKGGRQ